MNDYLGNRARLDGMVEQAQAEFDSGDHAAVVATLSAAVRLAWLNYAGVFLDRRIEKLVEQLADAVNARFPLEAKRNERIGFLMSSIHKTGGHSKIAWRWMQVDKDNAFHLVLTKQGAQKVPVQLEELKASERVSCMQLNEHLDWLEAVRTARDELAGSKIVVLNIHPDDVIGAIAAACLRHQARMVFINHAFYTFSLGMPFAHALACTSPAAVEIAVRERLLSPQHMVWYRNAPEWDPAQVNVDTAAIRQKHGLPDDAVLLLSSGTEYKYYPLRGMTLFELLAPVLERFANAYLVIVGVNPRKVHIGGDVFERFADRIILQPAVPERELLVYMKACDIYLESVPFHSGGASQQAMMLGKPVINYTEPQTYRAYLAPQFFSVDDFSWFHFSVDSYRNDLEALITNPELRVKRGQSLQKQVCSRVSEQDNLDSIQACYEKALLAPAMGETWASPDEHIDNPAMHAAQYDLAQNFSAYMEPARKTVVQPPKSANATLRAIAFHLPQYHSIPENDAWWGEGFTEWTNVRQGQPLFEGHHQPLVPTELGYYDLADVQVLERQAQLAREHGLEGFCFYHYWFDGKRLLEKPVNQLLEHPEIELPFCLCWANENWTRRWDGGEHEVLMKQSYSADLNEQFALDLLPYMSDARYIRINGKPVFLVYRCDIIPDLRETVDAWREAWRKHGLGEVYLIAVESFTVINPQEYGFDATSEFLPHQVRFDLLQPDQPVNVRKDPHMKVSSYEKLAQYWLDRPEQGYKRFRCIVPSWDNSSRRRKGGATVIHGSTPQAYEDWLRETAARTLREFEGEERLLFINAWNEWGEGCTLEPEQRYGRAYLEATKRVVESDPQQLLQTLPNHSGVVESWLQQRTLSEVQKTLTQQMLAARGTSCVLGVVVLDLQGDAQRVNATLSSLKDEAGEQVIQPLLVTVAAEVPQAYQGAYVKVAPDNWLQSLNEALNQVTFDWFMCVPAGAEFTPGGLHMLRVEISNELPCVAIFGDELVKSKAGLGVCFRPDFNLDLLLSLPSAMSRRWLYRTETFRELGGFDVSLPDAFEFGLIVRIVEQIGLNAFGHLSEPLVIIEEERLATCSGEVQVLQQHLHNRNYLNAQISADIPGHYRIHYGHAEQPLVSIIIPTKDQLPMLLRCVTTLMEKTRYPHYEVLIVDNNSETETAKQWLAGVEQMASDRLRVLRYPHPFNYSAINNMAAGEARGEYLVLLNNDTAILREDWLDALMNHGQRPEVGIVGAKLLHPDGTIQHAGVVLGLRGPADHPFIGSAADRPGYMQRMQVDQNLTAVTAACMLIRKSVYEQVGGLDEETFKVSYNDVDLCLKVREAGYLTVWTPHAVLMHVGNYSQNAVDPDKNEAKRERFKAEQDAMYQKWSALIASDPAYNPNMSLNGVGFELESDSLLTWKPLTWRPLPVVLAHPADRWGCGHYRMIKPHEAMQREGLIDGLLSEGILRIPDLQRYNPDVIVFQRQIGDARLEAMSRIKKLSRAFKVYELDDYLPNLPMKNAHRAHMPKDVVKSLRRGMGYVDRFVVSTEALADAFSGFHRDIRVMENRLPVEWWGNLSSQRRVGRKPRVGWAGGVSHTGDLEMIADVVRELAGEVEWVFMGMCPAKLLPYVDEIYTGVPIEAYPQALASLNLDLAIAPVEKNLFNECKSNLRLLEYGACGYPVICSDLVCYQGDLPATRVKNRFQDWVEAIRSHINDLDATSKMGGELREAVLRDWMLTGDNLHAWRKVWMPD